MCDLFLFFFDDVATAVIYLFHLDDVLLIQLRTLLGLRGFLVSRFVFGSLVVSCLGLFVLQSYLISLVVSH